MLTSPLTDGINLKELSDIDLSLLAWRAKWIDTARPEQLPPPGNWATWFIRAGRGFGKTRTGAEFVAWECARTPGLIAHVISPTHDDVRSVCFEGPAGLLNVIPPELIIARNLSLPSITLYNGSIIRGFAADTPERLRGPQCLVGETLVTMADGTRRRIDAVRAGDRVQTRAGARRVLRAWQSAPSAEIWELKLGTLTLLRGTMDHLIHTQRGFVQLCRLQPDDLLSFEGASTSSAAMATTCTSSARASAGLASARAGTCTVMSTLTRAVRSLAVITSTTWTRIAATTRSAIYSCSRQVRTARITCEVAKQAHALAGLLRETFAPRGDALRWSQPRARCVVTASGHGHYPASCDGSAAVAAWNAGATTRDLARLPARSAASPSSGTAASHCSASQPAEPRTDAGTATACSSASLHVASSGTRAPVYDLSVEGQHEFYANGVLVHNCGLLWGDEVGAWMYAQQAWDMAQMGLRLGKNPRTLLTGTPKPTPFIRMLHKMPGIVIVGGSTFDNRANLAPKFFDQLAKYEGTAIGRQELYGEVLDPEDSGFIKRSQWRLWPAKDPLPTFRFVLMSLDTALTEKTFDKKTQTGDPTACSVWGVFDHERAVHAMLLDCWEDHLGFPQLQARVKRERLNTYGSPDLPISDGRQPVYGKPMYGTVRAKGKEIDLTIIEDKGSGISLRQALAAEGILTHPYNPGAMDKLSRLHAVSPAFAQGRVWAVESNQRQGEPRSWAEPLVSQVCTYVGAGSLEHDDLLDTTTQALKYVTDRFLGAMSLPEKTRDEKIAAEVESRRRTRRGNAYG